METRNGWRYVIVILLSFVGAAATAATDEKATWRDYFRHGLIGCAPTLTALNMTLEKDLGISRAQGAGN